MAKKLRVWTPGAGVQAAPVTSPEKTPTGEAVS